MKTPRREVHSFAARLDRGELTPPVGPSQHLISRRSDQGDSRPRRRACLLKGCDRSFPSYGPFTRYCGSACVAAADRWSEVTCSSCATCARRASQRKANRKYRSGKKGKVCRRRQSCRYRQRCRERQHRPADVTNSPPEWDGEGYIPHRQRGDGQKSFCHRPGCYVRFQPPARSPLKKFCSATCRQAFRRVEVRDQRWRKRLGKAARGRGDQDEFG